ncbi:chromosome segregation protein SMC [Clostridium hydrogenum]|uniref:chromosome segregation protein SMC n=1 Tax=Clostridium hydrogenum TaxID=2855764 RepID=UPI001F2F422B|nr:chromosome segregation protein SMC [Clostridium hydrogenum]
MFLKSIEIRGFKSFADKTEIELKNGVTAVVGPNGSGKSNVSDAVRWVLGEQSVKSLRGGKMEDVIFAGTQFRKPVGLAQVSLTLDNSDKMLNIDYSDLTISRRLYRSGESEYYLNNTQCRLKDIQELFMDTGVGKEGYSIIGQGKIEAVLSGKPEERRGILEEAAGIVKFKARKEEAEKKLNNTEQNLTRIRDILGTYEERLEPLRIESEKAKKFVELSDELKLKEINIIIHSIDNMNTKIVELKREAEEIDNSIKVNMEERDKVKEEVSKNEDELNKFESEFSEKQNSYYESKSNYQKTISEIELLNEKINNINNSTSKIHIEIENSKNKLIQLKKELFESEELFKNSKSKQNEFLIKLSDYEKTKKNFESDLLNREDALKRCKNEAVELASNISESNNEIIILKKEIDSSNTKIENIKTSKESYLNSLKINESTRAMLQDQMIEISKKIEMYNENIKNNKKEMQVLNRTITIDEQKLNSLNSEYNRNEANKNALINLEKQYEGYNRSVKNLMSHIDKGMIGEVKGKCFVLGDIVNVEQKFETAIEIALGGAISDVITQDEIIAKTLINYLKNKNIGRATFLPLSILKSKKISINDDIKRQTGFIGIASELINYETLFSPAINYVLGRTVIADNMDNALNIAKKSGYSFKIVTLSGEVVNPGGSLTGGSTYNKNGSIIGRKREIEEFSNKAKEVHLEIDSLKNKITENRQTVKKLDEMCLDIMDSVHSENIEITKSEERIKAINIDNDKLNKSCRVSMEEIKIINSEIENKNLKLVEAQKNVNNLKLKEEKNNEKINEFEANLVTLKDEIYKLNEEITAIKVNKAKIDEIVLTKEKDLNRYKDEIRNINIRNKEIDEELKSEQQNKVEFDNQIKQNEKKLVEIKNMIENLDENLKSSEILRIKIKDKIKANTGVLENLKLLIDRSENEKHKYDVNFARLDAENKNLYNKLNDDYKITYAEALNYKDEIIDVKSYKNRIDYLNSEIKKIGIVNVGSIEEYKEVKEKYTFMISQKEDLDNAKEELLRVIKEMTDKMREVFKENFKKLNENFKETFKELFKGGSADLILAGEDELTCNIEINVQPPGKKLQNINLMSGGEKGLSAIALLFAILKMKPSPFCILDEIEAALDDANVFRYAEFLKKFSEGTQFIVITHRKGTMEAADILYGITMEEKGVSKVVSVDLNDAAV